MRLLLCLFVGFALVASCHKSHIAPGTPGLNGVYAAGWTQDSIGSPQMATQWKDAIWKNGRQILTGSLLGAVNGIVVKE